MSESPLLSNDAFWRIPDDIEEIGKPVHHSASPKISASKSKNDIRMLESGSFADCTVICGDQTWNAHKVILSRCPYFARVFATNSGFKEAIESKITIQNFEAFEVAWLLRYIYELQIDAEQSKATSPSKSFLETCALLWGIGDFFLLPDLSQSALTQLQNRCRVLLLQSRCASTMLKKIEFLPDLEAGIRAAWRHDRIASPVRQHITSICVGIRSYVKDHASFISLLDEIPGFTTQYVKALVGCPGMQSIVSHLDPRAFCTECEETIIGSDGEQVIDEFFVWTPTNLNLGDDFPYWYCSKACYNVNVNCWIPEEPMENFQQSGNS